MIYRSATAFQMLQLHVSICGKRMLRMFARSGRQVEFAAQPPLGEEAKLYTFFLLSLLIFGNHGAHHLETTYFVDK